MAIVTISQIKHRRGQLGTDPMPQLASAEMGWAVDWQELYIGNGTIEEGAPVIGNTRLLTEHSDLIALLSDYEYGGPFNGASVLTGPDVATPTTRSFTDRYDDIVSVRAFGATGDGSTDDTDALERAMWEHTINAPADARYWTTIHLPAGTYRTIRPLQIPSNVRLVGDGIASSSIILNGEGDAVFAIVKIFNPVVNMDEYPHDIFISDLSLKTSVESSNVVVIRDATNVRFERVGISGTKQEPSVPGANAAAVVFKNQIFPSSNIVFDACEIKNSTYGIASGITDSIDSRQDIHDLTITNCKFSRLFKGITMGHEVNNAFSGPRVISITNNRFDEVAREGIHLHQATKVTTGRNHFGNVGNSLGTIAVTPCIVLGDFGVGNPLTSPVDLSQYEGNYSIGDTFDREDGAAHPRIKSNSLNSYIIDHESVRWGTLSVSPGRLIVLANAINLPLSAGVTFDATRYRGAVIDYQLDRSGDKRRTGTMYFSIGTTAHDFYEDFTEIDPTGITFTTTMNGGLVTLEYTSTNETHNCVFSYTVRHLTNVEAVASVV